MALSISPVWRYSWPTCHMAAEVASSPMRAMMTWPEGVLVRNTYAPIASAITSTTALISTHAQLMSRFMRSPRLARLLRLPTAMTVGVSLTP